MPRKARKPTAVENEQPEEATRELPFRVGDYSPQKTRILYLIVTAFVIVLGVVWGWSIKQRITTFQWSQSSEARMISDAQKTWETINKERTDQDKAYTVAKSNIQKLIQTAIANASTTTSSSMVVSSTVATSTPHATSTKK